MNFNPISKKALSPEKAWPHFRSFFPRKLGALSLSLIVAACASAPVEEESAPAGFDPYYDSFTYFNGGYFGDGFADDDWYYDYYEWSDLNPYYGAFGFYDPETDRFEWEEETLTLE